MNNKSLKISLYLGLGFAAIWIFSMLTSCDSLEKQLEATVSSGISQTQTVVVATEQSIQTADAQTLVAGYTATSTVTSSPTPTIPSPTPSPTNTNTLSPSPTLTPTIALFGTASVRYSNTNIRYGPSSEYPIVAKLDAGVEISLLGQSEDEKWFVVLMSNGKEGWVSGDLINVVESIGGIPKYEIPPTPMLYRIRVTNDDNIPSYVVNGPHGSIELPPGSSFTLNLPAGEYEIQICNRFDTSRCGLPVPFTVTQHGGLSLKRIFSINSAYKP